MQQQAPTLRHDMQVLPSPGADRLCGNLNISFDGIEAEALLLYLDMKGVSVSAARRARRAHWSRAMC